MVDIIPGSTVSVDEVTLTKSGVTLAIKDAGVSAAKLAAGVIGEGSIAIMPNAYSSIVAGTWTNAATDANVWVGEWNNTTAANADECTYKVYLAAGTYTFLMFVRKFGPAGIVDVRIDGVSAGTIDCYDAGTVYNSRQAITGIVVATAGIKTLSLKINGKNGASSGYQTRIQNISLFRTA